MYEDPIVEEVRKTRERLVQEHNFDVASIFEGLRRRHAWNRSASMLEAEEEGGSTHDTVFTMRQRITHTEAGRIRAVHLWRNHGR